MAPYIMPDLAQGHNPYVIVDKKAKILFTFVSLSHYKMFKIKPYLVQTT